MDKLKFLHVGCGPKKQNQTTPVFNSEDWTEVRFDIDETHNPDILGSMTDMSMIDDNSFNAIYSSHNIEHLFLHEAEIAVKEFYRILKPSGYVFLLCPDIVQASKALYENGPNSKFYSTSAGIEISPIDVIYGWGLSIKNGNEYMAHKYGYSQKSLVSLFKDCNFLNIATMSRKSHFDIVLLANKERASEGKKSEENRERFKKLFSSHLGLK